MADRTEYDQFVVDRSPRLLRVAYLLTGDWAAAEDLLQTALVKVWFAWPRVHGDPDAYVRRTIVNTFISWRRRRWTGEIPQALPERVEAADRMTEYVERDALWRLLAELPRRQRAVLVLRYFEDLTEAQIAETLGISVGTVKSQASKGLAKLRTHPALVDSRDQKELIH
ncbi:SigE family RNA polymerase sigma factor [Micromonospora sp. NPDC005707]|uniref:SigE family RNA polymerase sigma factor n=1 Tax=Micromonospora sp. NPDC005707 TaxID=3157050 RepID=UPI003403B977